MVRVDEEATVQNYGATHFGRVAAHFYVEYETIKRWFEEGFLRLEDGRTIVDHGDALALIAKASEFDQIQVREDEAQELTDIRGNYCILESKSMKEQCRLLAGDDQDMSTSEVKTRTLIQAWIGKYSPYSFSLSNDMQYVADNAARICRALLDIAVYRSCPRYD